MRVKLGSIYVYTVLWKSLWYHQRNVWI